MQEKRASVKKTKVKVTSVFSFAVCGASKHWDRESFDKERFIPRISCSGLFARTSKIWHCLEGPETLSSSLNILSHLLPGFVFTSSVAWHWWEAQKAFHTVIETLLSSFSSPCSSPLASCWLLRHAKHTTHLTATTLVFLLPKCSSPTCLPALPPTSFRDLFESCFLLKAFPVQPVSQPPLPLPLT